MVCKLETAASALGTTIVARLKDSIHMLATGMRFYGMAISVLRNGQLTNNNWLSTLTTALLLQIYEVGLNILTVHTMLEILASNLACPRQAVKSSDPSGDGWMPHAVGICSILTYVGPTAVQEGLAHQIFWCCRLSLVRERDEIFYTTRAAQAVMFNILRYWIV